MMNCSSNVFSKDRPSGSVATSMAQIPRYKTNIDAVIKPAGTFCDTGR